MSKAIRNYETRVPADQSIAEIQKSLVAHGASGILLEYEKGTGRIYGLKFILELEDNKVPFQLPVEWRKFQAVLKEQKVGRAKDDNYCYRVAWRNIRDWVMVQMALYETQMVTLPQIFLPYAVAKDGRTMFEHVVQNPSFLLGTGKGEKS